MSVQSPDHWKVAELNGQIERLQREIGEFQAQQRAHARSTSRAARRARYLRMARTLRAPAASLDLWPWGALVVGPLVSGAVLLIAVNLLTNSLAINLLTFAVGAAAGAAALAALLFRPADAVLPAAISSAESERKLAEARWKETVEQLAAAREECRRLEAQRRELMASGKVQRAALLQRPWKAMPETEWEDFVVEACRTLGASVERSPRAAEADADLLVQVGGRSIAVVTRGAQRTLNSGVVQQALTARQRHGCQRSAVIVNRRFTGAAQEFARRRGCTLIGIDEFPDFVMGNLEL